MKTKATIKPAMPDEEQTAGSLHRDCSTANSDMTNFGVEYEHNGQTWRTVIEAYDREHAYQRFQRDHPHVKILSVD